MPSSVTVLLVPLLLVTPAVISWLWLVIVPLRVTKLCPEGCGCDIAGYYVDCSNTPAHNFPSISLTHVQTLVLDCNNISSLENDSFISKGLTELDVLALGCCGLQTIELGAFNGLTKLTFLSMRQNAIKEIKRSTFEVMRGLKHLGLQYNEIEHLDVNVFSGLFNLHHINLAGNKLLELDPDIFVGLPKLESLDLSANGGLQIPTDRHFITSHSLKFLQITFCNISAVSIETFANVSALEWLDLRYNDLRRVDTKILKLLPKLSSLSLSGNPLLCDCQLKEVWRWCYNHDILASYELYGSPQLCDRQLKEVRRMCQDHNIRKDSDLYSKSLLCDSQMKEMWRWHQVDNIRTCDELWPCLMRELPCVQDNISNKSEYKQKHYEPSKGLNDPSIITLIILALLYLFISIFGTAGNVIILIIIICNKEMQTVPNTYIVNLAISDLIFLTLPIADITVTLWSSEKTKQEFWCRLLPFCNRMSVGLSAYCVAVLSIQRYRLIVNPLQVRVSSKPTWRITVSTICGVWIVAALFAIPSALSEYICFGIIREERNMAYYKRVFTFELLVFCVLPLFVIAFFYTMTAHHLVKSADLISEETQNPQLNKRKNVAKYVMGLTVVFMISCVPYYAFWAYTVFNLGWELHGSHWTNKFIFADSLSASLVSYCLFLMNSSLNPVALFCTSSLFRKHLKRYLCCCCKANSPPTDIEITRRN
jgi:hypothetical protein